MEQKLAVQHLVKEVYPSNKEVLKRSVGDTLRVYAKIDPEIASSGEFVIETWSDFHGKFSAYKMSQLEQSEVFFADFKLSRPGSFTFGFRWRMGDLWHWSTGEHDPSRFAQVHVDPAYLSSSVVYNAFVRFFGEKGGKPRLGRSGTFDDLKQKLDELRSMGVDILYLNPIHPIGELYRNYNPHDLLPRYLQPGCPYSIRDYKSLDPELGVDIDHSEGPYASLSDPMVEFRELVKAAHNRGMRVYMDLVFNHTSHDFVLQRLHPEWFLYKDNIKSLDEPYLNPSDAKEGKPWGDPAHTFCPFDHGFWWEDAAQLNWEFMLPQASNEPPRNPTIKEMYEYFKSIPKYWIRNFGIDGFRCDVAYRVPPKFWRECIAEAREVASKSHPKNGSLSADVVFIAESYVDELDELFRAGFSAVYGDFSNKLYTPLTLKGYVDYMLNLSGKHFPEGSRFFIFPECHDFIRNTHKLLSSVGHDKALSERANKSRWLLTATLPGIPMIFNGFEKLEWHPVNLFSYSAIDWESDPDLKKFIARVNKIRHSSKALCGGDYEYIETSQGLNHDTQLFCFARTCAKEKVIVCVNMDLHRQAQGTLYLPRSLGLPDSYVLHDVLCGKRYSRSGSELFVILGPAESHVFKVRKA